METRREEDSLPDFLSDLKESEGEIKYQTCRNRSGVLWQKMWRYHEGSFQAQTLCSGISDTWKSYSDERAQKLYEETEEIIERVRDK